MLRSFMLAKDSNLSRKKQPPAKVHSFEDYRATWQFLAVGRGKVRICWCLISSLVFHRNVWHTSGSGRNVSLSFSPNNNSPLDPLSTWNFTIIYLKILHGVNSKACNWNAKIQTRSELPHHWSLYSGIKLCNLAAIKAPETFWLFHSGEHHWSFSGFLILEFSSTYTLDTLDFPMRQQVRFLQFQMLSANMPKKEVASAFHFHNASFLSFVLSL